MKLFKSAIEKKMPPIMVLKDMTDRGWCYIISTVTSPCIVGQERTGKFIFSGISDLFLKYPADGWNGNEIYVSSHTQIDIFV